MKITLLLLLTSLYGVYKPVGGTFLKGYPGVGLDGEQIGENAEHKMGLMLDNGPIMGYGPESSTTQHDKHVSELDKVVEVFSGNMTMNWSAKNVKCNIHESMGRRNE